MTSPVRNRAAAFALALVLVAQAIAGLHYIERTALNDGPAEAGGRAYVLWDDAMISMRYARNLAAGDGLVWNPNGERVQGYTNLGLTLVMAAVHKLGVPPERTSLWIQLLALGCLMGVALLAALLVRRTTGNAWAGVAAALALLLSSPHQIYALQGADTIFVSVLLLAGAARLVAHDESGLALRYRLDGFIPLLLAVLVRPDATLFVVCAAGVIALLPDARGRALALRPCAMLAGVWIGLVAFSLSYYGDPLPNTWYLKATGSPLAKMLESGLSQLGEFGIYAIPSWALLAMCVARVARSAEAEERRSLPLVTLLGSFIAIAGAYHVWVGGDWMREYGSRHLVQQIPALIVLAALGAWQLARFIGSRSESLAGPTAQAAMLLLLLVAAGGALNPPTAAREWFDPERPTMKRVENQGNFDRARFIAQTTTPDTTIAAHWAGVWPYFAEREALDVLGRSDRHIAHMHVDRFIAGHSKWDWDYVLETRKPDIIDFESRGLRQYPRFLSDYAALVLGPKAFVFVRYDARDKILDRSLPLVPIDGGRKAAD